jgi:mono/diheme cytochrome c family protein
MRRTLIFALAGLSLIAIEAGNLRADRAAQETSSNGSAPRTSSAQTPLPARAQTPPAPRVAVTSSTPAVDANAVVQKTCVTCHNDRAKSGGLTLQNLDPDKTAGTNNATWEKVVLKLRGGMMPPLSAPNRPDPATLNAVALHIEQALDRHALASPDPGQKAVHRLNRTEYGNAVRDLLELTIDPSQYLPADDESDGFDNIAGVLRVSPSLLEQYLSAARQISSLAVGFDNDVVINSFRIPPDDSQEEHVEGLPLGTRGGLLFRHNFPQDAEYDFNVFLLRNIVGYMTGLEYAHQLEITIDGERAFLVQVGGEEDNLASDKNMSETADMIDKRLKTRVKVKAGPHMVGVTFHRRNFSESDEPLQPHERDHDLQNMNGLPMVDHVTVTGPFNATGPGETPSRRRIFTCHPASAAAEPACARTILSSIARRAYRRPVTDADMMPLISRYEVVRTRSFDAGFVQGVRLILANPKFIFRTESDPVGGRAQRVSDLEMASRLSFFLWSSIPDDELLNLAAQNRLNQPAVLAQQVRRMLKDPKSRALVDNFASQWLMLRNLKSHQPNPRDFPNFDNELRQAFRTETEMFFESIMREDRSVIDLLDADYTFVNERLARHYKIPNVYGSYFRRVTLKDANRRGLLGQGSILTITSYPNRTSPVLRGKWILENILGTPPSAPPPNVPTLKENGEQGVPESVRARLELHRKNATCASCHAIMDPLGFALENFDGVGMWRQKEIGGVVDATGQLADGTPVNGPVTLRDGLLKKKDMFARTLTQKLMTYGLGRGLEASDMPLVRAIAATAGTQNYRFSTIVLGIVNSVPFTMKKPAAEAPVVTAQAH